MTALHSPGLLGWAIYAVGAIVVGVWFAVAMIRGRRQDRNEK